MILVFLNQLNEKYTYPQGLALPPLLLSLAGREVDFIFLHSFSFPHFLSDIEQKYVWERVKGLPILPHFEHKHEHKDFFMSSTHFDRFMLKSCSIKYINFWFIF